jgi:GTP-binding protein
MREAGRKTKSVKNNESPRPVRAEFLKSAQGIGDAVEESLSEVVFLGRSNVGKSSTINLLAGRKNLAKSSSTPGKTRLINFFDVGYRLGEEDYTIRFVDLPGFGYARVSKSMKEAWQKNLVEFIRERRAIRLFVHLRDARHPRTAIDDEVERYIREFLRPDQRYLTVFTKADKLKQKEKGALLREFPGAILVSNLKKSGQERVRQEIFKTIFGAEF